MPSETHRARKALIIYLHAPEDKTLRQMLDKHMSTLKRRGLIDEWSEEDIPAGSDMGSAYSQHINDADIILLLVSAYFVSSDDCYHIQIVPAMARHNAHEAVVIPILLRPTRLKGLPFAGLQWLPRIGKAVTLWSSKDEAFLQIVESIGKIIESEEPSSSVTSSALPSLWLMPHRRNPFFSARERDLDKLHHRFTKEACIHRSLRGAV